MSHTESLTRALQAKAVDIAVEHCSALKNVLSDAHSHVDIEFHACMREHQGLLRFTIRHHKLHGDVLDKLDETIVLDPKRSIIKDL